MSTTDEIKTHIADARELVESYYTAETPDDEPRGYQLRVALTRLADDAEQLLAGEPV